MANMYDITDYKITPRENPGWFSGAIFGGDVFEKGKITPLEDVKGDTDLNLFSLVGDLLQRDGIDCAWTPKEIAKLTKKQLQVITYKINAEQCIPALEKSNLLWSLGRGARFESLPTDLQELTLFKTRVQLSEEVETLVFAGNSNNEDEFDGVVQTLIKSSESIRLKGVTHTKDNILQEIEKTYLAAPKTVVAQGKRDRTLNIYMSYEDLELVEIALAQVWNSNLVISPSFAKSGDIIKYMGVEIVPCLGLTDTIVLANSTNLILGTDLISDTQELEFGQFPKPHDDKVYLKGRLRLGFAIPFEDECIINSVLVGEENTSVSTQSAANPNDDTSVSAQSVANPNDDTSVSTQSVANPNDDTSVSTQSVANPNDDTSVSTQSVANPNDDTSVSTQSAAQSKKGGK